MDVQIAFTMFLGVFFDCRLVISPLHDEMFLSSTLTTTWALGQHRREPHEAGIPIGFHAGACPSGWDDAPQRLSLSKLQSIGFPCLLPLAHDLDPPSTHIHN